MTFRGNFLIDTVSSMSWVFMNLGFYILIFEYTPMIGAGTGWGKYEFFLFLATTLLINSLVQAFFMPNAQEFSELIRTGTLDFALLKPIDTQFLVSLTRVQWSALGNFCFGLGLMAYAFTQVDYLPGPVQIALYPLYVLCGVAIFYSLMIALAATSIWLGRNQSLYNFWFYITNFSRYPMEIYRGPFGTPLRQFFTFIIPVLVVVNVPARLLVRPLNPQNPAEWFLPAFGLVATVLSLAASRWIFTRALLSYRSASS
jgi:ABC-2 type transport system permease protein